MKSFVQYLREENLLEYEHYVDAQGRRWNDEGEYDGDPKYRNQPGVRHAAPVGGKFWHNVKFADKNAAKAEGMRFDPTRKMWYHTDAKKSRMSAFQLVR